MQKFALSVELLEFGCSMCKHALRQRNIKINWQLFHRNAVITFLRKHKDKLSAIKFPLGRHRYWRYNVVHSEQNGIQNVRNARSRYIINYLGLSESFVKSLLLCVTWRCSRKKNHTSLEILILMNLCSQHFNFIYFIQSLAPVDITLLLLRIICHKLLCALFMLLHLLAKFSFFHFPSNICIH